MEFIKYLLDLGGFIFVPMVMIIIGLIFRLNFRRAIKAGILLE